MVRMDFLTLTEALALRPGSVVALVGGGGKTSTLVRLCQESAREGRRALATTTTRMKMEELAPMDDVLLWDDQDDLGQTWKSCRNSTAGDAPWIDALLHGRERHGTSATFLGRTLMRDKVIGLPSEFLGDLIGRLKWDAVVVEADGSRGRSIKGHRLGEPAIPLCATHCVVVIGADGIGQPVNEEYFHRPEVIQELTGVGWGEPLPPRRIVDLFRHPRGLLSKIPGDVEVAVYVNKAPLGSDHAEAIELAREILTHCGSRVRRIALGDNRQGGLVEVFLPEVREA
jgi:probable selenium-dependent hydroxylase accessory protein YqeC